jgi:hypothetical protein
LHRCSPVIHLKDYLHRNIIDRVRSRHHAETDRTEEFAWLRLIRLSESPFETSNIPV